MPEEKKKRPSIDWESMEPLWRAGVVSVLHLSKMYNISRAAIIKHWRIAGVERDLSGKITARADALVTQSVVTKKVTPEQRVTEQAIVEANAEMIANVIRGHRKDAGRLRGVVQVLLEKVEVILSESELFKQIGEMCAAPDDNGVDKVNELYRKVIDLPSQTDVTKKLAETMKVLIELERKVFKLDTQDDPGEAAARGAAEGAAKGVSESSKSILNDLLAELKEGAGVA